MSAGAPPGGLFRVLFMTVKLMLLMSTASWELARLDALQANCWDRALAGELEAVRTVTQIAEQPCRLLG